MRDATYDKLGDALIIAICAPLIIVLFVFAAWFSWTKLGPAWLPLDVLFVAGFIRALVLRRRRRLASAQHAH